MLVKKLAGTMGFSLAAFGMALGLICFESGKKHFPKSCDEPNFEIMKKNLFLGLNV